MKRASVRAPAVKRSRKPAVLQLQLNHSYKQLADFAGQKVARLQAEFEKNKQVIADLEEELKTRSVRPKREPAPPRQPRVPVVKRERVIKVVEDPTLLQQILDGSWVDEEQVKGEAEEGGQPAGQASSSSQDKAYKLVFASSDLADSLAAQRTKLVQRLAFEVLQDDPMIVEIERRERINLQNARATARQVLTKRRRVSRPEPKEGEKPASSSLGVTEGVAGCALPAEDPDDESDAGDMEEPGQQRKKTRTHIIYKVDNAELMAPTIGLGYRLTPQLDDHDNDRATWGSSVSGLPYDDLWVKIGDRYLPNMLKGKKVLTPIGQEEHTDVSSEEQDDENDDEGEAGADAEPEQQLASQPEENEEASNKDADAAGGEEKGEEEEQPEGGSASEQEEEDEAA